MAQLTLVETTDTIILTIPKTLIKKGRAASPKLNDLLELVKIGREEYRRGETVSFNSIKELLARDKD